MDSTHHSTVSYWLRSATRPQFAPLAADVRRMYSGRNIADAFTALALLIDTSPLGRTMGNVYFSVARLPMPMKMFTEESKALEWLDGHRT